VANRGRYDLGRATRMSGPRGDVAELTELLGELRGLVREAHEAAKDARAAIRECKALTRDMADACAKAAFEASNDEMARWAAHVQREMNARAADLNRAVIAARDHIGRAMLPKIGELLLDSDAAEPARLVVEFSAALFDAEVPVPPEPEIPPAFRRGPR
jgi:uncharacterized protein YukE